MPLAPGQSLLHFRLVDKLGEGGMGEVWRALDEHLDRQVAIKVLPAAFASDPERLARFEREAKVLAALNHPNIAAIYGFPEGAPSRFLAMELVPGEDLSAVVARGPMPLREALDAARQVAAALEAAHERGVIHRDLKPANVKRTPNGTIKVLDFGLAKALEVSGQNSGMSATVTSAGSHAGMILGTASYMSPEQARGQTVDRRTDLWAFGCLLYEMLTGTKAFDGATVTDVLAAIVTGEPDWKKLPESAPPSVRRLLHRCLEKDLRKRLRDAGDAGLLLDENPDDVRLPERPIPVPTTRWGVLAAVALLALAGGAGGAWWWLRDASPAKTAAPVSFKRVTYARGLMRAARFAPDGQTIIYGAGWGGPPVKLYLARTESRESTPIGVPPGELLAVSRQGEVAVALGLNYYGWMGDGTLARTSLLGGALREIMEDVRSADFSPDGKEMAIVRRTGGVDQLEYPEGKVLDKTNGYFSDVRVSPDGQHVAYLDHSAWGDNQGSVAIVDRSGKKTTLTPVFQGVQGLAWSPRGEIWFTEPGQNMGSAIHAVDPAGKTRVVFSTLEPIELFDVAADGRALVGSHHPQREGTALLYGWDAPRPLVVPGEVSESLICPDGKCAVVLNHIAVDYETLAIRADRPGAVRLSSGNGFSVTPDGTQVLVANIGATTLSVVPMSLGPTREVPNPEKLSYRGVGRWLPDGKRFAIPARKGSEPSRGYVVDAATGAAQAFGAPGVEWGFFLQPPVTPDGKFVVLQDAQGGLQRWPIDGGEPLPIPNLLEGDQPINFTVDGHALFVAGRGLPIPIVKLDLATGERTPWLSLAPTDAAGLRYATVEMTADGKHWVLGYSKLLTDLYVVEGLK